MMRFQLKKYAAMFSDEGMQMKRLILSFQWLYENERLKYLNQRDITDFFYTCLTLCVMF